MNITPRRCWILAMVAAVVGGLVISALWCADGAGVRASTAFFYDARRH
ncbi:hypothetical protein LPH50_01675 [Xylella taiwanensis]|uniref:Uncharacterized protein n=1 Tax=Xylella taiwanensis TaxID=1444770 RepID=A0ABS8TQN3_9GAMM|nr:hypothetical protein [Xylella taiwanensis]MCD8456953.1 hypothetical protein [Xylella taiwanensis]MCD8459364.1 hypothetical protein [Xylella taiwanensis]MCD8461765.1 hypothetical protein [Xylella taiwanensis]MCD8462202.1 hypothetical protein [Xylella taiwanensis]MCD8465989.1 hypothetical protein [Xylella taiwanensis]